MGNDEPATSLQPAARTSDHSSLWRRTPHRVTDWFDAAALEEARSYARPLNRLRLLSSLLSIAILVGFVVLDGGVRVVDWLDLDSAGWVIKLVAVIAAYELIDTALTSWIGGYVSLVYDKRHGLSTQTPGSYLGDVVKSTLIGIALTSVLLVPVLAIIRSVDTWWLWAWLVFIAFSATMALVYPVAIMPRFNKFVPLEDGELRTRIERVASLAGEQISGVFTMDASKRTRRDNAFVAGFGPTKRVVLFDTMLEHPPEMIEQVVAHEIGHYRLKHIQKSIAFMAVLTFAVFAFLQWFTEWRRVLELAGVESMEDPRGVVVLLAGLGLGMKGLGWISSWYSRAKERQADLEALELLGNPPAFIDVWRRMAPKNKAELETPWWKRIEASHPEIAERMAFGADWQRRNPDVTPAA
ncbi:MAG: M48 family metallopeptidase [Actinomycetota bacterium]